MKSHRQISRKKSGGFSLVELMVAMVIALLGTIVIFQVFASSEQQKRTTVSGGDAQQSGAIALFSIEQEARMGGFGLNHPSLLGCSIGWFKGGTPDRGTPTDPPLKLTPIEIIQGVGGLPDTITITYGNSDLSGLPGKLSQAMPNSAAVYKVVNRFGFNEGDMVVAAQTGKPCTLAQVTDVPGAGDSDNVVHNPGKSVYNKASGLDAPYDVSYDKDALLINLGPAPTVNVYSILNNSLVLQQLLLSTAKNSIADGIVQLQARYGKDTTVTADGMIDVWNTVAPVSAAEWSRVLAVRIALVARSSTRENPGLTGAACTTTTTPPQWLADPITKEFENIDLNINNANPNWRCYRYKTFQTAAPLRNMIWRPES